jgi:hypothetical protein
VAAAGDPVSVEMTGRSPVRDLVLDTDEVALALDPLNASEGQPVARRAGRHRALGSSRPSAISVRSPLRRRLSGQLSVRRRALAGRAQRRRGATGGEACRAPSSARELASLCDQRPCGRLVAVVSRGSSRSIATALSLASSTPARATGGEAHRAPSSARLLGASRPSRVPLRSASSRSPRRRRLSRQRLLCRRGALVELRLPPRPVRLALDDQIVGGVLEAIDGALGAQHVVEHGDPLAGVPVAGEDRRGAPRRPCSRRATSARERSRR